MALEITYKKMKNSITLNNYAVRFLIVISVLCGFIFFIYIPNLHLVMGVYYKLLLIIPICIFSTLGYWIGLQEYDAKPSLLRIFTNASIILIVIILYLSNFGGAFINSELEGSILAFLSSWIVSENFSISSKDKHNIFLGRNVIKLVGDEEFDNNNIKHRRIFLLEKEKDKHQEKINRYNKITKKLILIGVIAVGIYVTPDISEKEINKKMSHLKNDISSFFEAAKIRGEAINGEIAKDEAIKRERELRSSYKIEWYDLFITPVLYISHIMKGNANDGGRVLSAILVFIGVLISAVFILYKFHITALHDIYLHQIDIAAEKNK